jgi:hypothetical protein
MGAAILGTSDGRSRSVQSRSRGGGCFAIDEFHWVMAALPATALPLWLLRLEGKVHVVWEPGPLGSVDGTAHLDCPMKALPIAC